MKNRNILLLISLTFLIGIFACTKDAILTNQNGNARFEITDAPIDDNKVTAVYVTITGLKVDGSLIENFIPVTVDLKALHSGKTKILIDKILPSNNYKLISLVMDYDKDDKGQFPGAYVLDDFGKKHPLQGEFKDLELNYDFSISQDKTTNLLIDVDLRKLLIRSTKSNDYYDFPSFPQLITAFRVVDKNETGNIFGNAKNLTGKNGKLIAYAYKAGTYNAAELMTNPDQPIEFVNAIKSEVVDAQGNFKFRFLEKGEYEIQFARFVKDKSGDKYILAGTYKQDYLTYLPNNTIKVTPNNVTNIDLFLTGLVLQ